MLMSILLRLCPRNLMKGLPFPPIHITIANVADCDGAIVMIRNSRKSPTEMQNMLVGGATCGEKFLEQVKELIGATVEIAKRNELHKFAILPKCWIVERSFAWIKKCRRLWKNYEKNKY